MANKKFSEFTLKTDSANVDFVVGYDGTDNVRIAPSNLSSGGASSLNGLTDCSVTSEFSQFIGNVPSGVTSGNAFYNTCLGHNALESLTGGAYNTVIGFEAGDAITSNNKNTVFGAQAFSSSNSANVTAIGYAAGNAASGNDAVYVGYQAGKANTADRTIAIGYQAGYSQTSGGSNTVIGERAAYSNTTGENNTSVGDQTAYSSTGSKNTSVGKGAFGGGFGHSGSDNVAIGYLANQQPSGASNYNVAIGSEALRSSGTRSNNVAVGYKAGTSITSGGSNTLLGYQAGDSLTTGSNNTVIGHDAEPSAVDATNEITLGDANIATLRCQVQTISSLSDSRDKTNVQTSTYGLDFINKLNPVTFDWDMRDGAKVGDKDLGFIAQELQEVDDENLQLVYANNPDRLEASYGRLIPVLVKAIQELKLELDNCKNCK